MQAALTPNVETASTDFSGLWIPLITPFNDGAVDHAALAGLVKHFLPTGIAGFVVCGSTGEAAALDDDEQLEVLATVRAAAPGLPLVMGVSGYHLGKTIARVQQLNALDLAGILLPAPNYIRPSQAGLVDWFTRLADASAVPVVIYDIPYRTGSRLELETLLTLAAHPRLCALKDCGGDDGKTRALIADGRIQVLSGEDVNILSTMAQGGTGAIAATAHLHTARIVKAMELAKSGDIEAAEALWQPLVPLIEAVFAEPNPGPLKALLSSQGLLQNELRSPMTVVSKALEDRLKTLDRQVSGSFLQAA
ncbi:MAG: 4-hydroxy-tetrahydrodipicolinate synthase [Comamonadaceae bacterium]|nr:MAG: 4-hydroxy-tetrahydrodipicolinate synthase [Comamonadaceae bacterium]